MSVKNLNLLYIKFVLYFSFVIISSGNNDTKKRVYGRTGLILPSPSVLREKQYVLEDVADFIPESFDAREKWPHCPSIGRIEDQGECDSCWAVATASTLTDRWCIGREGDDEFEFSAGDLLSCCSICAGENPDTTKNRCDYGGSSFAAIRYWMEKGVVSGSGRGLMKGCKPYSTIVQETGGAVDGGRCDESCTNPDYNITYSSDKRFGVDRRLLYEKIDFKVLQTEIMRYGPVISSINSTKHFTENGGRGIYSEPKDKTSESKVTLHAVKILGWGIEDGKSYWLLANSWGPDWGAEKGFFKLLREVNQLGVEYMVEVPCVEKRPIKIHRQTDSAVSLLNSMRTFYFMIFNIFMYFYV